MQADRAGHELPRPAGSPWQTANTCDQVKDLREGYELPFEWDYAVNPAGPAGFRCWGDTDQIIISPTSDSPDDAFNWMLYRSSKEAWEEAYDGGIILAFSDGPTRKSIFSSKAYMEPLGVIDTDMIQEGLRVHDPESLCAAYAGPVSHHLHHHAHRGRERAARGQERGTGRRGYVRPDRRDSGQRYRSHGS